MRLFDFHGVRARILALDREAEPVLGELEEDVRSFRSDFTGAPEIELRLISKTAPSARHRLRLFRARLCTVYRSEGGRRCDYGDGTETLVHREGPTRVMEVYSPHRDELYEVAYMGLLSMAGEILDRRGWHRVHALGLQMHGKTALLMLPQGGGKSALAVLLGQKARILSDEIPLLKGDRLFPFPIRMALKPEVAKALDLSTEGARLFRRKTFPAKFLFSIPDSQVGEAARVDLVLVGRLGRESAPRIQATRGWRSFWALTWTMIVGIGVPQMAEHFLRRDARLLRIFFSRLWTAARVSNEIPAFVFDVGPDARENADVLDKFLKTGWET